MAVMVLQSLLFAGGVVLAVGLLTLAPSWVQRAVLFGAMAIGVHGLVPAALRLEGGALMALLMCSILAWGLDAIMTDIRRANAAAFPPSGPAPGGAQAPGEAGKRDGERHAPILPAGGSSTAGCAGRSRSFWGGQ